MKLSNTYFKLVFIIWALLCGAPVFAQGAPAATPIDGGLSLLLAAGGLYGLKKLKDQRK